MRTTISRRPTAPVAIHLGLFLLALFLLVALQAVAAETTLTLGRTERWGSMATMELVRTTEGRWGELDLVLAEAAYESSADTDLLLHFDELPYADAAGRYDVHAELAQISGRERMMGAGAAVFVGSSTSLRLTPRRGSLFSAGTMWQDFSIELWLYPATLSDGESVLSFTAQRVDGSAVVEQRMDLSFRTRRLVWSFDGFFGHLDSVELRGTTALVPRQWHHHLLRFDSRRGMLEYLVDGVPEAVSFATDTRREGGSIALPVIGGSAASPLLVGGGVTAMVDELRVSRRFVDDPTLSRLHGRTGIAVSRIFDLDFAGTKLESIEAVYETPRNTDVYFSYRMADRLKARGELETSWVQFVPGLTELPGRGRYFQLMVELFPDGTLEESPSVSSIVVRYEPDLPPAPPARIQARAGNSAVSLSWSRVNESDVAGYRVYVGSRPGVYQSVVDVGKVTEYEVEGLENGRLYYFTVATYDSADPRRRSAFAPEAAARPSALEAGRSAR